MESQNGLGTLWFQPPPSHNTGIVSDLWFPRSALRTESHQGRTGPGQDSPGALVQLSAAKEEFCVFLSLDESEWFFPRN